MHGQLARPDGKDRSIYRKVGVGFLVLPACIAIALIALAIVQPSASNWISEAVQAEFVGDTLPPGQAPTQIAEPASEPRNVTASWLNAFRTTYRGQR